jgi:hypothetical protein
MVVEVVTVTETEAETETEVWACCKSKEVRSQQRCDGRIEVEDVD